MKSPTGLSKKSKKTLNRKECKGIRNGCNILIIKYLFLCDLSAFFASIAVIILFLDPPNIIIAGGL